MTVDIVMPTYNNREELRVSLESLCAVDHGTFRVLVCVDGSTDDTLEYLPTSTFPFPIRTLQHEDKANHGRAATRNLALPYLDSKYVLLLDTDMRLVTGGLKRHLELLEEPGLVSVGDVVYLNAATNVWARYLATRGKNKYPPGAEIRPLDFATANTALRTEELLAIGGFDDTLTEWGGEDTELAFRLWRERGQRFIFNPDARAETVEDKTVAQGLAELRRYAATNLRTIRMRYPDAPAPLWVDRVDSGRLGDRAFRALLNPVTDWIADLLLPVAPFSIKRRLLNYKVIRAVFDGYAHGATSTMNTVVQ